MDKLALGPDKDKLLHELGYSCPVHLNGKCQFLCSCGARKGMVFDFYKKTEGCRCIPHQTDRTKTHVYRARNRRESAYYLIKLHPVWDCLSQTERDRSVDVCAWHPVLKDLEKFNLLIMRAAPVAISLVASGMPQELIDKITGSSVFSVYQIAVMLALRSLGVAGQYAFAPAEQFAAFKNPRNIYCPGMPDLLHSKVSAILPDAYRASALLYECADSLVSRGAYAPRSHTDCVLVVLESLRVCKDIVKLAVLDVAQSIAADEIAIVTEQLKKGEFDLCQYVGVEKTKLRAVIVAARIKYGDAYGFTGDLSEMLQPFVRMVDGIDLVTVSLRLKRVLQVLVLSGMPADVNAFDDVVAWRLLKGFIAAVDPLIVLGTRVTLPRAYSVDMCVYPTEVAVSMLTGRSASRLNCQQVYFLHYVADIFFFSGFINVNDFHRRYQFMDWLVVSWDVG